MTPILSLIGPTGTGKTHYVCQMAKTAPFEIISLDSAMVYTELSVGANKPSAEELKSCPHHLINCCSVTEPFDVAKFFHLLTHAISEIVSREKIPVIVGGTMMYAHVLQAGLIQTPTMNATDKHTFLAKWAQRPLQQAYERLCALDPLSAERINPCDSQRISRALEIATLLPTIALRQEWQAKERIQCPYPLQWVGLRVDNVVEHRHILQDRIQRMLDHGMLEEMESLYHRFGDQDYGFWKFVAYRQYHQYFKGEIGLKEAEERTGFATYQLAKHQRTWMNTLKLQNIITQFCQTPGQNQDIERILQDYAQSFKFS